MSTQTQIPQMVSERFETLLPTGQEITGLIFDEKNIVAAGHICSDAMLAKVEALLSGLGVHARLSPTILGRWALPYLERDGSLAMAWTDAGARTVDAYTPGAIPVTVVTILGWNGR